MWKGKDVWTKNGEIDRQAALRVDNALGVAPLSSHFSFVTRFEKKMYMSLAALFPLSFHFKKEAPKKACCLAT